MYFYQLKKSNKSKNSSLNLLLAWIYLF